MDHPLVYVHSPWFYGVCSNPCCTSPKCTAKDPLKGSTSHNRCQTFLNDHLLLHKARRLVGVLSVFVAPESPRAQVQVMFSSRWTQPNPITGGLEFWRVPYRLLLISAVLRSAGPSIDLVFRCHFCGTQSYGWRYSVRFSRLCVTWTNCYPRLVATSQNPVTMGVFCSGASRLLKCIAMLKHSQHQRLLMCGALYRDSRFILISYQVGSRLS